MKTEARKRQNSRYQITPEERDWRAFRGESPNPWRKADSAGTSVMQIITCLKPSKLEHRSGWDKESAWYAKMPLSCYDHAREDAYLHEQSCPSCKAFMDYARTHPR